MFSQQISEGTIVNMIKKASKSNQRVEGSKQKRTYFLKALSSVLVSDLWPAQSKIKRKEKLICLAKDQCVIER